MRSYHFPKMFQTNSSNIWKSAEFNEMTKQNTIILLHCERGELLGDPYYGLMLKHYLFDQNNYILRDALIDVIYTQIAIFIPQVKFDRKNIEIIADKKKGKIFCKCSGISQIDYTINTYNLVLFDEADL